LCKNIRRDESYNSFAKLNAKQSQSAIRLGFRDSSKVRPMAYSFKKQNRAQERTVTFIGPVELKSSQTREERLPSSKKIIEPNFAMLWSDSNPCYQPCPDLRWEPSYQLCLSFGSLKEPDATGRRIYESVPSWASDVMPQPLVEEVRL
jgi:hypothetical protein